MMRRTALALATVIATALAMTGSAKAEPDSFSTAEYGEDFATGLTHSPESEAFESSVDHQATTTSHVVPSGYSLRGNAGPVENQRKCGSCWDFSLTSALRGTMILGGKDPGRLSFNYLLNCDAEASGCEGGSFTAAAYLDSPKGAPTYGSDGAYTARQGSCVRASAVASAVKYHMLGANSNGPSFRDIAYVVGVLHRPVTIDVFADSRWKSYRGGVYNGCDADGAHMTNHMIVIEGYSCESSVDKKGNCQFDANGNLPPGVGTWVIRNSWGTGWGDRGYITTKATDGAGRRCNAVASSALYFDLK